MKKSIRRGTIWRRRACNPCRKVPIADPRSNPSLSAEPISLEYRSLVPMTTYNARSFKR